MKAVRLEEGLRNPTRGPTRSGNMSDEMDTIPKDPEFTVPIGRLNKAKKVLDGCAKVRIVDELYHEDRNARLLQCLAQACPSWIAITDETNDTPAKWFAGGHRARGAQLPDRNPKCERVLLFSPRAGQFRNKADRGRPHVG